MVAVTSPGLSAMVPLFGGQDVEMTASRQAGGDQRVLASILDSTQTSALVWHWRPWGLPALVIPPATQASIALVIACSALVVENIVYLWPATAWPTQASALAVAPGTVVSLVGPIAVPSEPGLCLLVRVLCKEHGAAYHLQYYLVLLPHLHGALAAIGGVSTSIHIICCITH